MKKKVNAIYAEELKKFLEEVGDLSKIQSGEIFCEVCNTILDIDSIQLIIPHKGKEFTYVCDRPDCVEQYYEKK